MEGKSFWNDYFQKSQLGLQLNYLSDGEKVSSFTLPDNFNTWCKGNVNNAKFLLVSIVREILYENDSTILIIVSIGKKTLPIDLNGFGDFKIGAKNLIQAAVLQSENLDYLDIQDFSGILITDFDSISSHRNPIIFSVSQDLKSISIISKTEYEAFSIGLIENVIHVINPDILPSQREFAAAAKQIVKTQNEFLQTKKEIIEHAWKSVFEQNLNWDKNYYANGGDSIQAIRLLSKLKEQGAEVDLAGLISAFSLKHWIFDISENLKLKKEFIPEQTSFPLTEMQQKIWSHHQSFKNHGAYHEQFLFELKLAPSKELIESCINAIWKSYPNLRIHIQQNENQISQNVVDDELTVQEYTYNSIDNALKEDRNQPFDDSLLRLKIILVGNRSYLLWSHHHLILDGWSVGILIHEFIERITFKNFEPTPHPNYQYQLHRFENDFPAGKQNKEIPPIIFPINDYQKGKSFQTIQFEELAIDLSKEDQLTEVFQITKQLLFCGISGIILNAISNKNYFYFNGISSGRDFLEGEIDQAVGLFIRNIQIPILLDESTTWHSYFHQLNSNFQQTLSTRNRIEHNNDFATNSDFLFIYENYPYTDLKSDAIEAELIHVNEITGYPITFCVFPKAEGYALRIVYDARRFDEQFIIGLKIKFEQTYSHVLNSQSGDSVFKKKIIVNQIQNAIAIDSLTKEDFNEIEEMDINLGFIEGPGWNEIFDDLNFSDEKKPINVVEFWQNQLFSQLPGMWKDVFVKEKKLELKQSISTIDDSSSLLLNFINYLKLTCWNETEFQLNIQKNNAVFPLIIRAFKDDVQLNNQIERQLECLELYLPEFLELFADHWSKTSNFLVVIDNSASKDNWERFDFVLNFTKGTIEIHSNESISSDFTNKFLQFLTKPESVQLDDNLSYFSNLNNSNNGDFRSFKQLFQEQVEKTPNRLAVDDGDIKLTYQELDSYSNQIARYFNYKKNLSDLSFIGVRIKRNTKQLASILALIKLGKAFIPLDTNWPEYRMSQIVEQADLKFIIDEQTLDGIQHENLSKDALNFELNSLNSPFYALFTSGSTGIPKGCVISEFAFLNYLDHCKSVYFQDVEDSNIHVFTPLTFDFTLTSFLGGIAFGATVILHSEDESVYDSIKIALGDNNSSVLKLTPSHISLAENEWFSTKTSKTLIVGGEALTKFQIKKCLEGSMNRLINEYGPTEATVGCVFHEIKRKDLPLIGLPINGMGVMVLDEDDNLVSKGREGELCLFGNGLSEGYLNDIDRTNQSFQNWNKDSSFRIYRTGDVVKMQHDGQLIFISRKDGQVKLNGYRIETDEINFAIKEISGLNSHSLVIENGHSKQLVTFVEGLITTINLFDELKKRLPIYMLPAKIIEIDKFPVTSNGKLDLQKLTTIFHEDNKNFSVEKHEILNIQEILEDWKKLRTEFQSILSFSDSKKKGWNHIQRQINFLHQVQACAVPILIPKSTQNKVPKVLSNLDFEKSKIAKGKAALLCKGTSFSLNELKEYAQQLNSLRVKLSKSVFSVFTDTVNNFIDLSDFEEPLEIESNYISYLKVNEKALVRDWSAECGFPFIVFKNSTGELICVLPLNFKDKIIDRIGYNQPEEWTGKLPFLKADEFSFRFSNGQIILNKQSKIERFSQIIDLSLLEKLVHKINKTIECAIAKEIDKRIYVFIQLQKGIDLHELEQSISNELPSWFPLEKIIQTNNLLESVNEQEIQIETTSFIEFLKKNLPEYGYLNGSLSLIEQGGDSITALRIVGKLKNKGYFIEVGSLLNAEKISNYLLTLKKDFSLEIISHDIQLTPIQEWFLDEYSGNKNHFNQSILLELLISVEPDILLTALQSTLESHSILSHVFDNKWKIGLKPRIEHFRCETEEEVTKFCSKIQASFNLKVGPVACGAVIEVNGKILLFLSIHHLYCDGYTWRIILDDLQEVMQGRGIKRESSMVYGKIRNQFHEISNKNKLESIAFYGTQIQNPFKELTAFSYNDSKYVEWEWSEEETKWFLYSTDIGKTANEKFLFLFLNAWLELNYEPSTVFFETHGRFYEGIPELTETIGWFTQFYPIFCSSWPKLETLKTEIVRQFEELPKNGLTYMGNDSWHKPPFPILLNYLGNFDENRGAMAIPSSISQGDMTSVENQVLSMVELNALIVEGKMKWMLRMHPQLDPYTFKNQLNNSVIYFMENTNETDYIDQSINQDDLDAINDLLAGL
jgi:amino acid adenylation domain-containing protein